MHPDGRPATPYPRSPQRRRAAASPRPRGSGRRNRPAPWRGLSSPGRGGRGSRRSAPRRKRRRRPRSYCPSSNAHFHCPMPHTHPPLT
jgi:hypothetical protein